MLRRGLEAADRHQAADVGGGDALPWIWKAVGVEAEAFPEAELVQVGVDGDVEHAVIFAALIEAAAVGEGFAVIGGADADAALGEAPGGSRRGSPRPAELRQQALFGDAVVRNVAISPRRARQCREAGSKHAAKRMAADFGPPAAMAGSLVSSYFSPQLACQSHVRSFPLGALSIGQVP